VRRQRILLLVLGQELLTGGFLAFRLPLPEHGESGVRWDQHAHRVEEVADASDDVLGAVRVAGDHHTAHLSVQRRTRAFEHPVVLLVEAFDHPLDQRGVTAPPDGCRQDQDLGSEELREDGWPGVPFTHVGIGAGKDLLVDQLDDLHLDLALLDLPREEVAERLGVREARLLQRTEQDGGFHEEQEQGYPNRGAGQAGEPYAPHGNGCGKIGSRRRSRRLSWYPDW